jgi:hypothetical protein
MNRKLWERILLSVAIYSALGGLYILMNSWVHPKTLPIQLSHLTPWIREDTFGILCWITSFFSFTAWNVMRK